MLRLSLLSLLLTAAACDQDAPLAATAPVDEVATDTASLSEGVEVGLMAWTGGATWTSFTSDNLPPVTCPVGSLVTGFDCSGSNCDDVRLKCQPQTGHTLTSRSWTSYFSEEATNFRRCTGFMTGLAATGSYSDNLSMECTTSSRSARNCVWSAWFSEEDPNFEAPTGTFVRALQCSGGSCDNMRAEYCQD